MRKVITAINHPLSYGKANSATTNKLIYRSMGITETPSLVQEKRALPKTYLAFPFIANGQLTGIMGIRRGYRI